MKPEDLKFAPSHEWVHVSESGGNKIATVGISSVAVEALTDLVYMDLPAVGDQVSAGNSFGEVESVKATSDLYSPVDGKIVEVNTSLPDNLDRLSADPYGDGWIIKVQLSNDKALSSLLNYKDYQAQNH